MKPENENLEELFGKFINKSDAEQAAEDINKGEQLIGKFPAPKPDAELLRAINLRVNKTLQKSKYRRFTYAGYWASAAAAVILIAGLFSINMLNKPQQTPKITDISVIPAVSNAEDFTQDDTAILLIYAQMQEIEDTLTASKDSSNIYSSSIDELEIEFMEISNDFWKG